MSLSQCACLKPTLRMIKEQASLALTILFFSSIDVAILNKMSLEHILISYEEYDRLKTIEKEFERQKGQYT